MNGVLAEMIALTSFGNMFLVGQDSEVPDLVETNRTFRDVDVVRFYLGRSMKNAVHISDDTTGWFSYLRSLNAKRLWLRVSRNDCEIQTDLPRGHILWANAPTNPFKYPIRRPRPGRPNDGTFWGRPVGRGQVKPTSLESARRKLLSCIIGARDLVSDVLQKTGPDENRSRGGLTSYLQTFAEAIQLTTSSDPRILYYPEMLPSVGYSLEARQVAAASARSWVFGGMGSWTDMDWAFKGFERKYRKISRELHEAVVNALAASTNSFLLPNVNVSKLAKK